MATRTISRDANNSRVVCVWGKGILVEDVKVGQNDAMYARDYDTDTLVQPTLIPADVFKSAFGFLPLTGSVASYQMHKAVAAESVEEKIISGIKALVKSALSTD
jgi:hypothetical protein